MEAIDIFILINGLKAPEYGNYIDLIRVFGFIKNHINKNGYVIFGKYFDS